MTQSWLNDLQYRIIGCAIEVHRQMGPGLLESIYEECLFEELTIRGISAKRQVEVPVMYKGKALSNPLRLDLIIEDAIIVECKAVKEFVPIFEAQLLSYLALCDKPKGLLINFRVTNLVDAGVKSLVTSSFSQLPK